ncbi:hypothetical protein [Amycolatopsis jejuensis]|uniref:hypothetical protein n=1 Tax=Amycolatopsis jejuensis TaxID=330084 RepID=UPI0005268F04|nr:hypothetical protein [Amycolatopsis jejuensis]
MGEHPSADEAARALQDVGRRREQALGARHGARWVDVVFALVVFLYLASADFLPSAAAWKGLVLAVLVVGYVLMLRTRRGGAWLGHRVRVDKSAVRPRIAVVGLVFVVVCVAAALAVALVPVRIPYGSTILGAVLAIGLIGFGPHLRRALVRPGRAGGAPDGHA